MGRVIPLPTLRALVACTGGTSTFYSKQSTVFKSAVKVMAISEDTVTLRKNRLFMIVWGE